MKKKKKNKIKKAAHSVLSWAYWLTKSHAVSA
jgi:hypothetical protein